MFIRHLWSLAPCWLCGTCWEHTCGMVEIKSICENSEQVPPQSKWRMKTFAGWVPGSHVISDGPAHFPGQSPSLQFPGPKFPVPILYPSFPTDRMTKGIDVCCAGAAVQPPWETTISLLSARRCRDAESPRHGVSGRPCLGPGLLIGFPPKALTWQGWSTSPMSKEKLASRNHESRATPEMRS